MGTSKSLFFGRGKWNRVKLRKLRLKFHDKGGGPNLTEERGQQFNSKEGLERKKDASCWGM